MIGDKTPISRMQIERSTTKPPRLVLYQFDTSNVRYNTKDSIFHIY